MRLTYKTKFDIEYPTGNFNYYTSAGPRERLQNALLEASNYYCMYCGTSLYNDNKIFCNLEHSVEKKQNNVKILWLQECKYNLSVTCPTCNIKYKKIVKPLTSSLSSSSCSQLSQNCTNYFCSQYYSILNEALNLNNIILQPFGAYNINTNNVYEIEFDIFRNKFLPSQNYNYTSYEYNYIRDHISRFNLNGKSKSHVIEEICCDILEDIELFNITSSSILLNKYSKKRYSNVIGNNFMDFIASTFYNKSILHLKKFCEFILILTYI